MSIYLDFGEWKEQLFALAPYLLLPHRVVHHHSECVRSLIITCRSQTWMYPPTLAVVRRRSALGWWLFFFSSFVQSPGSSTDVSLSLHLYIRVGAAMADYHIHDIGYEYTAKGRWDELACQVPPSSSFLLPPAYCQKSRKRFHQSSAPHTISFASKFHISMPLLRHVRLQNRTGFEMKRAHPID